MEKIYTSGENEESMAASTAAIRIEGLYAITDNPKNARLYVLNN